MSLAAPSAAEVHQRRRVRINLHYLRLKRLLFVDERDVRFREEVTCQLRKHFSQFFCLCVQKRFRFMHLLAQISLIAENVIFRRRQPVHHCLVLLNIAEAR